MFVAVYSQNCLKSRSEALFAGLERIQIEQLIFRVSVSFQA